MNRASRLPRLICLLIALVVGACFVASASYERAAAQAANGRIAFTSSNIIYTINPDGSGLSQLTPIGNGFFDRYPAWSPNGARIVFGRATFTIKSQIYVMNEDGSNPTRLTNNSATDWQPSWSPDGTKIAFVSDRDGNNEIYVMNADGSNQTRLTNNTAWDFDPAWSPDGTKIAFTSSRDFTGLNGNNGFEIYVMCANGANPIRLTNNSAVDAQPSWSADGTRIAFSSQRDGLPLIYVMNADGSNPLNVTQSTTLDSSDPEWSPDGTTIAFTSYERVGRTNADEIFLINADGSNIRRVTTTSFDEHELAWQPLASAPLPTPTPTPTATPSPTPDFTISGTVTDSSGKGLADVTMILQNDIADTQITFTNQTGNYVFHYAGGNGLFVTPSKSGFIFNPQSIGFVSSSFVTGNQTASFTGIPSSTPSGVPILLGWETPEHAIALDSVTMTSEPFTISNTHNFSSDQRTCISLFAVNVELGPGETTSVITAQAEDSLGQVFPLTVEYFGAVPNFGWLKQVIVKLPDEIANKVEVRVSLKVRGTAGNKVIIKVKP
jgi:dipeptidyl aminopeptidase/acylaminoacyl peptidase